MSRFRGLVAIFEIHNLAFELSNTRRVLRCEETNFGLKKDQRTKKLDLWDTLSEKKRNCGTVQFQHPAIYVPQSEP